MGELIVIAVDGRCLWWEEHCFMYYIDRWFFFSFFSLIASVLSYPLLLLLLLFIFSIEYMCETIIAYDDDDLCMRDEQLTEMEASSLE